MALLHCHMDHHVTLGMQMVFNILPSLQKPVPAKVSRETAGRRGTAYRAFLATASGWPIGAGVSAAFGATGQFGPCKDLY